MANWTNKKWLFIAAGALLMAAALVFSLVGLGGKDVYQSVLPNDATALGRVDVVAFADDCDLSPSEQKQLSRRLFGTDDIAATGLDLSRPVFAFASQTGYFGFAAAVSSEKDFTALCENARANGDASELTRQRGLSWVVLKQQWLLTFDGRKALVMGPAVGSAQDQLRTEMVRLMDQKRKESGVTSRLYELLGRSDEAVAAVMRPELLPEEARKWLRRMDCSSGDDALVALDVEADGNELKLNADILAVSDDAKASLQKLEEELRPVKGELTGYAGADCAGWLTMNLQGAQLLETLRSDFSVRTALVAMNLAVDVDRIITSFDGDLAISLNRVPKSLKKNIAMLGDLSLTARVANTDFLDHASSWGNHLIQVNRLSPTDFSLSLLSQPLFFGVQDHIFYLASEQGIPTGGNDYLRQRTDEIRGARLFATFKAPELLMQLGLTDLLPQGFDSIRRVDLKMEDAGELQLRLVAPENVNIVKQILKTQIH